MTDNCPRHALRYCYPVLMALMLVSCGNKGDLTLGEPGSVSDELEILNEAINLDEEEKEKVRRGRNSDTESR